MSTDYDEKFLRKGDVALLLGVACGAAAILLIGAYSEWFSYAF